MGWPWRDQPPGTLQSHPYGIHPRAPGHRTRQNEPRSWNQKSWVCTPTRSGLEQDRSIACDSDVCRLSRG